jgi:adenosylcobinamide-phosphate synthase
MTFLSILFALLIEQLKPLRADNPVYGGIKAYAVRVERWFNAGHADHGRLGWFVVMLTLVLPTLLIFWLCEQISPLLTLGWNIVIIYLTLGFRHYSHYFTAIQYALNAGDTEAARQLLAQWLRQDTTGMDVPEISRLAVEKALLTTHRHVFGVFFWFLMPLGPAGAVMYRVAEYLARAWSEPEHMRSEAFGRFAIRAYYLMDWVPARLTASAFAIVGNFEDAVYAWRNFAQRWQNETTGIILSAGGGAMGVRLGTPQENATSLLLTVDAATIDAATIDAAGVEAAAAEAETLPGEEPGVRSLQSTVGLVWRALLLWMMLLLLISLAVWLG